MGIKSLLLVLGIMSQAQAALPTEQIEVVAATAPHAESRDDRVYKVILQNSVEGRFPVNFVPMTEAVASAAEQLQDGNNICEGRRFKGQVFELTNCHAK